ncbi:MAG: NAD-binding protein, partial [Rhodoferax sp.]
VLDNDAQMIEAARTQGYQVHYGDPTRLDLLRIAGADQARVLVIAVNSVDASLAVVDLAKQHFPHLQLVVRARDVAHWNALRARGVLRIEREMFEGSLKSGLSVLELLGQTPQEAHRAVNRFRTHNLALLEKMHAHHKDRAKMIAVAKQGRQELEEQMAREREEQAQNPAA